MQGPSRLAPGTRFAGEYTIVRPLAEGGMGEVYVARQDSTGRERALKVMHPWLVEDPQSRLRFEREARVSAGIESDHVVDVVGAGVDEATGLPWIAMELLTGKTLAQHLAARGSLSLGEVREILAQVAHALGAAHRLHLVHRDLKPDNVVVADTHREGERQTVKLLDFGIAKLVQERRTNVAATSAIGSPLWMAPEQTDDGHDITPRTDVFAFGLLAFWLLTGRSYWMQPESGPVMLRQLHVDELVPATARAAALGVPGRLPAGFDVWFAKAVARDPADRYPDATVAMAALDGALARAELGMAGTMAVPAVSPPPRSTEPAGGFASGASTPGASTPGGGFAVPVARPAPPGGGFVAPGPTAPMPAPWITPVVPPTVPPTAAEPARRSSPALLALLVVAVMAFGAGVGFLAWAIAAREEPAPRAGAAATDAGAPPVVAAAIDAGPSLVPMAAPAEPAAPVAPLEPLPPPIPFRAGQAWTGSYVCAQGRTPLTLQIRDVDGLHVQAIFVFRHPQGSGRYHLRGDYEPAERRLRLTPGAWIQRPPGFVSVGMNGTVDEAGRQYAGRMLHPSCESFRVQL